MSRSTFRPGFTLVELLVVLAILGALAGLIAPMLHSARRRADRNVTSQEISRLSLGIHNFADMDRFGTWPPAALADLGISGTNGVNEATECLVLCLSTQRGEGPYFDFDTDRLTNTDLDVGPGAVLQEKLRVPYTDNELKEYVDLWENPYIYFPASAYGKPAKYLTVEQEEFQASVIKDEESGRYPEPLKFLIWSCGPNGVNENGGGDDIISWN